ncbi:MAG: M23 family metallopeptidase [Betaproteobacteria bacterium]|nr:M23 family metallopeptidase [Betaproteobacteria bacterium]
MRNALVAAVLVVLVPIAAPSTQAAGGRAGGGPRIDYEVIATGLAPVFPERYSCDPIASGWGSAERFDGSARLQGRNSGMHGGLDISLREGTPLLAVAAGKVIAKGEGGMLEGIYLWMQHAPEDTGLPYRAITKYQHLSELPKFDVGDRVTAGQVVAHSGLTGTRGQAFGPAGYAHLHLSLFVAPAAEAAPVQGSSPVPPRDGKLSDPMLLYLPSGAEYEKAAEFSDAAKRLAVAVVRRDGRVEPSGSKVIWPVSCIEKAL